MHSEAQVAENDERCTKDLPPRPIKPEWLRKRRELLAITLPSSGRDDLVAEIELAEHQDAAAQAFLSAASAAGYRYGNKYRGRCADTGAEVEAGLGFIRKNETSGKWQTFSWAAVAATVGRQR